MRLYRRQNHYRTMFVTHRKSQRYSRRLSLTNMNWQNHRMSRLRRRLH